MRVSAGSSARCVRARRSSFRSPGWEQATSGFGRVSTTPSRAGCKEHGILHRFHDSRTSNTAGPWLLDLLVLTCA
jgi:hypothetical protein